MSERVGDIARFLAAAGWADAERRPLAGDASFRRYVRLVRGGRSMVLMDAPPPMEDVRPYLRVARHLARLGYSAPAIYAEDVERGLLLVEDFGDATYTRELARGADEGELYTRAVDLLIDLHRRPEANEVALPPYDDDKLLAEAALLVDWFLPALRGAPAPASERGDYLALWRPLFSIARRVPSTLALRDYHADNLMLLAGRDRIRACGLLDFQDAVLGPVAYDLVSLLEDARRDVAPELVRTLLRRYLDAFPALDRTAFKASYAVLGAQRNAKIIGIFTRLWRRDGKAQYLALIPRVWSLLEGDLAHPALEPMRAWFDRHVPPGDRVAPRAAGGGQAGP
ncbi:MAG: aminoglycoside phosphotransferase family protein [Alphaproteobacteria bacterium]